MNRYLTAALFVLMGVCSRSKGETPHYGSVGLLAVSKDERDLGLASSFGREIAAALKASGKVDVRGELNSRVLADGDEEKNFGIFRESLKGLEPNQLVVVAFNSNRKSFKPDSEYGRLEVSVPFSDFEPKSSYATSTAMTSSWAVHGGDRQIKANAEGAAAWIVQSRSSGKEVAVMLKLTTVPGKCFYTFGASGPHETDEDGMAIWRGTKPEGVEDLSVTKARYKDQSQKIDIKRNPNQSFLTLSFNIRLKKV